MPGELIVAASVSGAQFPDATFLHNIDKPFEIHRMIPRLTGLSDATPPVVNTAQPEDVLERLVRLRINDFSKNELLMKAPQLVDTITKGTAEKTWEFAEPYTLVRSEGLQISVDTLAFPVLSPVVASIRVEIAFQGFLIVVAPPSEAR
jgi:hypothetical protein